MTASKEDIFAQESAIMPSLRNNLEWLTSAPLTHKIDVIRENYVPCNYFTGIRGQIDVFRLCFLLNEHFLVKRKKKKPCC